MPAITGFPRYQRSRAWPASTAKWQALESGGRKENNEISIFHRPAHGDMEAVEALNRFCGQHRIAAVEKQFVADGRNSFWSFCICYLHRDENGDVAGKGKIDYREVLDEMAWKH